MIEKVNPSHPDKVADRIAGAIVDLAYTLEENPKVACEVLIGHGVCHIIIETSVEFEQDDIFLIVNRIAPGNEVDLKMTKQDANLAKNQDRGIHCGDNGIFKGTPLRDEDKRISKIARKLYERYPSDGKYILSGNELIVCQSNANSYDIHRYLNDYGVFEGYSRINPIGEWTGGTDVDTGATNRKLGSDMGMAVTGGGLHGKDLSKADVSVNIYAHLKAQALNRDVNLYCAIGDEFIDGLDYSTVVEIAHKYVQDIGGFEKLAEWGLF